MIGNQKKLLKRDYNKVGLTILSQQVLLYIFSFVIIFVAAVAFFIFNPYANNDQYMDYINKVAFSGTYMILAVMGAFFPVFILRGKKFFTYDIKEKNKPITLKVILASSIIILTCNFFMGYLTDIFEFLLNKIGYTSLEAMEYFDNNDSKSMIFYVMFVAPVMEELFFRGAILRHLEKHGAKFAIIASAVMFGFMHGNIVQIPNGIVAGIILGYLAKEYSLKLSIIIHMINNIYAQGLTILSKKLSENVLGLIILSLIISFIIFTIIWIIRNKNNIRIWLQNNKIQKGRIKYFFTSITIIITIIMNIVLSIFSISKL